MYYASKVTIRDEQINCLFYIHTWNRWKWVGLTKSYYCIYHLLRGTNQKLLYLLFILKQFTERPQKWASDECFWSQQLLSALMNKLQSVTQWGWCWHILLRWFLYSCQERYLCLFQLSVAQQWYRWSNWPWGPFMANACFSFTLFFFWLMSPYVRVVNQHVLKLNLSSDNAYKKQYVKWTGDRWCIWKPRASNMWIYYMWDGV